MRLSDVSLFEVPVYRCSPEQFNTELDDEKREWLKYAPSAENDPQTFERFSRQYDQTHRFKKFGWVGWRYNEAIAWIRVIVLEHRYGERHSSRLSVSSEGCAQRALSG